MLLCHSQCTVRQTLDGLTLRICSDACFINYHKFNNLPVFICDVCSSVCSDKRLMLKREDGSNTICGEECLVKFKEVQRACKTKPRSLHLTRTVNIKKLVVAHHHNILLWSIEDQLLLSYKYTVNIQAICVYRQHQPVCQISNLFPCILHRSSSCKHEENGKCIYLFNLSTDWWFKE